MQIKDYITKNLPNLNWNILPQIFEENNVELTEEIEAYLRETPGNTNWSILEQLSGSGNVNDWSILFNGEVDFSNQIAPNGWRSSPFNDLQLESGDVVKIELNDNDYEIVTIIEVEDGLNVMTKEVSYQTPDIDCSLIFINNAWCIQTRNISGPRHIKIMLSNNNYSYFFHALNFMMMGQSNGLAPSPLPESEYVGYYTSTAEIVVNKQQQVTTGDTLVLSFMNPTTYETNYIEYPVILIDNSYIIYLSEDHNEEIRINGALVNIVLKDNISKPLTNLVNIFIRGKLEE